MSYKKGITLLFFILLFVHQMSYAGTEAADTWANVYKYIGGNFNNPSNSNFDTKIMIPEGSTGRYYIDKWLVPGVSYQYKFIADINGGAQWEPSNFSTNSNNRELTVDGETIIWCNWGDTPSAPANLSAFSSNGAITVMWNYGGNQNLDVFFGGGYDVYYCTYPTFTGWIKANSDTIYPNSGSTVSTLSYTINGLTNDSTYYLTVRSFDAYHDTTGPLYSPYADSITATPTNLPNVVFRIYMGNLNPDTVWVGYDTTIDHSNWFEYELSKEPDTGYWSGTIPMNAGLNFTYKYITYSNSTKTYEFSASGRKHMFIYPETSGVSKVQVKGSWDNWSLATELTYDEDGYWRGEVTFSSGGLYEYKFIENGYNYVYDPLNSATSGGNSLLIIQSTTHYDNRRECTVPVNDTVVENNWEDMPYTPTGFRASAFSDTAIKIFWDNMVMEDIDTFYIEYTESPADSTTWLLLASVDAANDSYVHNNVIIGDSYYYRIWAKDYNGNESQFKNFAAATSQSPVWVLFKTEAANNILNNIERKFFNSGIMGLTFKRKIVNY